MEKKQITGLLQKYYDGMSNPEEEKRLLDFFRGDDVPEEFDVDRRHLLALSDMQNEDIEVPKDLEYNILSRLAVEQSKSGRLKSRMLFTLTSVAAGLALVASTFLFLNREPDLGTYDDPLVAYTESREILEMVSASFNQGTEKLKGLGEMEEAIQPLGSLGKVDDVSGKLKYLEKFNEGVGQTRRIFGDNN